MIILHFSTCRHLVMPAPFVDDTFFFLLYIFDIFVKNQVLIGVQIYVNVFDSIPLVHVSVFMPILNFSHYYSSIVELEVRDGDTSRSSFLVQDCFSYPGFFVFPYEVEYCFFGGL